MKYIRKHFDTLEEAEQYQDKLYEKYDRVYLVSCPLFEEYGVYSWQVEGGTPPETPDE